MAFKTEAIVLHARTLRGADRMYELLTPREGRLSLVARGAGKSTSKMAGHLTPFSHVRIMVGRGKQDHLAGVATIRSFRELKDEWFDFILASSLVELVVRLNVSGVSAQEEFDLLLRTLNILSDQELSRREKVLVARMFLWKILMLSGWRPNLSECAECRQPLPQKSVYYQTVQGFMCEKHRGDGFALVEGLVPFLEALLSGREWRELLARVEDPDMERQWFSISQVYYQDIVSRPLQSLKLFAHAR